jgi:CheY-like chemotaxis protein
MSPLRILHVDDEPDIREVVELSLGLDPEFETRGCASGQEALTAARDWSPDVILLDVMMPHMDGPTTLARLRENAQTAMIPVVFMTARARGSELDHFRALGALGVIPKPFDPMSLAGWVRSLLEPKARMAALRGAFVRRVADNADALAMYRAALKQDPMSAEIISDVRDLAHSLAGAAGIYGFSRISDLAAALEEESFAVLEGIGGPAGDVVAATDRLLAAIEACGVERGGTAQQPN